MPLPVENVSVPNAVVVKNIVITTEVQDGGNLLTSALLILQAATVNNNVWQLVGEEKRTTISNVESVDEDLVSLQETINGVMLAIIGVVGTVNSIRKIV